MMTVTASDNLQGAAAPGHLPLGPALDFLRRLWRLNHALERVSSRMETRLGITAQQRLIIRCVGKFPGIGAGQLAALLHVDPGTTSAGLRRLEAKGLVERRRSGVDHRRVVLALTERGRELDTPTPGTVEEAVEKLLMGGPPEHAATALAVLERFTGLLEAQAERP